MQRHDPFNFVAALTADARRDLTATGRTRRYARGAAVIREDDDGSQVVILHSGTVKVSVAAPSGRDVIVHVFDDGSIVGELSAVDGAPRAATVTALTDVEAVVVRHDDFLEFLGRHAEAATALLRIIVAKVRAGTQRQLEFATAGALSRVCRAFVDFGERYGKEVPSGIRFVLPMTQQDLAAFVGVSREAVVKALATLRTLGWITTSGREVTLTDLTALEACARDA
jgi:CRP-like cAMP-binding protein